MTTQQNPTVVIAPLQNKVVVSPDESLVTITTTNNTVVINGEGMQGASGGLRVLNIETATAFAPDSDNFDQINFTALETSLLLANPVGSAQDAQKLLIRILDNGIAQTLVLSSGVGGYRGVGVAIPTTTVAGLDLYFGCIYNAQSNFWDVIALTQQ